MVSKKEIITYLKTEAKFEQEDSMMNCKFNKNRSYFVEVLSRNKNGWTHVFYNPVTDEILEFNRYFMSLYSKDNDSTVKLNKNNEECIDSLIKIFLRK